MIVWDRTDAYRLGDWMIYFVETVFKPSFCAIRYLVYVWTTPTVYALIFTVKNKPRRAGYAVFTCIMYNVKCIILVTMINKINQSIILLLMFVAEKVLLLLVISLTAEYWQENVRNLTHSRKWRYRTLRTLIIFFLYESSTYLYHRLSSYCS